MKINISPSTGFKMTGSSGFKMPAKTPVKSTPKVVNNITGSFNMSQRDAEQAALDGAYHNTQMYGSPLK